MNKNDYDNQYNREFIEQELKREIDHKYNEVLVWLVIPMKLLKD